MTTLNVKRLGRDLIQTLLPLALGIAVAMGGQWLALLLQLPFLAVAGTLGGICLAGLGPVRLVRRVLFPDVDLVEVFHEANVRDPGRAWLGLCIVIAALILALATLGGEKAALTRVMHHLLPGPLRELAHRFAGVLTVTPTRERLWTEQFEVSWVQDKAPWPAMLRTPPESRPVLERRVQLAQEDVARLVRDSGLAAARPEYKPLIWKWPS